MSYSVPECFMAAFAAGLVFALVYEALRIVRVILPFRAVIFLCDAAFFLLAAVVVTKLSLALGNYIRWSAVMGFGAGVFAYITTVGRLLNILENSIANAVRTVLAGIFGALGRMASKFFGKIAQALSALFVNIAKIYSTHIKKLLKPLKKSPEIGYNNRCHIDTNGGSETVHVIKAQVRRGVNP